MARKFLTMDGNEAAAHAAYAYTEVATIPSCLSMSMSGQQPAERISSARRFVSRSCSPRQALLLQFTAPSPQVR